MCLALGPRECVLDIVNRYERWAAVERRSAEPRARRSGARGRLRQAEPEEPIDIVAKRPAALTTPARQLGGDIGIELDRRPHASEHT